MNGELLFARLAQLGVRLEPRGASLRVNAPPGVLTTQLVSDIKTYKPELRRLARERVVVIDFETRSLAELSRVGGRAYVAHPSTEVLCMAALAWDGRSFAWTPNEAQPTELLALVEAGIPLVAHNADGFDRFVWQRLGWPAARWIDTLPLARQIGLPGDLERLATKLLGAGKDRVGRKLTLLLSRPDAAGRLRPPKEEELRRVRAYCLEDVRILAELWRTNLGAVADREVEVRELDRIINDRGFAFDARLASAVIDLESANAQRLREKAGVPPTLIASPEKLRALCAEAGVDLPNVQRETLLAAVDDPELPTHLAHALEARLASSGITGHKLRAALGRLSPDGRLRDTLSYHAAHTGRWGGRGFQPQNLPRIGKIDLDAAVRAALARDVVSLERLADAAGMSLQAALAALVRPCVVASPGRALGVADFASIEARALLWLAGDHGGLDVFRAGIDPYKKAASALFAVPVEEVTDSQRQLGKANELGCGFGMGQAKFRTYAENYGVDWNLVPFTPDHAVEAWRDAHPEVAGYRVGVTSGGSVRRSGGLWRDYESAAMRAAQGEDVEVGAVAWRRVGDDVACFLPSGRQVVYPGARVEPWPTSWGAIKSAFVFDHKGKPAGTYGGKLTENITQAVARDLLVAAMFKIEAVGIPVVLHVHDEVVAELATEAQLELMLSCMQSGPDWAKGLPLDAKGYVAGRYRK